MGCFTKHLLAALNRVGSELMPKVIPKVSQKRNTS